MEKISYLFSYKILLSQIDNQQPNFYWILTLFISRGGGLKLDEAAWFVWANQEA